MHVFSQQPAIYVHSNIWNRNLITKLSILSNSYIYICSSTYLKISMYQYVYMCVCACSAVISVHSYFSQSTFQTIVYFGIVVYASKNFIICVSVQTPVHCACELVSNGDKCRVILELLLRHGGDLYQRDNAGVTPINLLQWNSPTLYTTIVRDFCSKYLINLKIIL